MTTFIVIFVFCLVFTELTYRLSLRTYRRIEHRLRQPNEVDRLFIALGWLEPIEKPRRADIYWPVLLAAAVTFILLHSTQF